MIDQPDTNICSRRDAKAWCLFFNGDPVITCLSHSREKVRQIAIKMYLSEWYAMKRDGFDIRMVWISERQKGQKDANS